MVRFNMTTSDGLVAERSGLISSGAANKAGQQRRISARRETASQHKAVYPYQSNLIGERGRSASSVPIAIEPSIQGTSFGDHPISTRAREGGLSTVGVRLNHLPGSRLHVPDVASLPRALRDRTVKRWLDVIAASFLLVALSPLLLLVCLALRVSGGPILFQQPRVGRARTRFVCLKFRTMHVDAEQRLSQLMSSDPEAEQTWAKHQKLDEDPRVTGLGRWLRRTSIDELPQLINVLRGDMSLVGPRPIIAPEVDGYPADRTYYESADFADYAGCVPGITGLWQIAGRHRTTHAERRRLDGWYARHWSVVLDAVILWRTVGVVLGRSGT